ncbi:flagellar hook-length control protein FliK [Paenalcaligenes hominis]|uniref:flagellar hook-length control protein FliK n=1 Tax=Paenalcaligenes hominis TaxID=643674 RepID=UPI003525D5CB
MSIGPSTLGNLLVQRLDSALGVSQTTQHRTGAHPDALRHTQSIQRLIQSDTSTARSTRESVDKAQQQDSTRLQNRADSRLENQLQKYTDHRFTPSAPTTLGKTARTILALLTQYAHQPVQGQRPLLTPHTLANATQRSLPTAPTGMPVPAGTTATTPTATTPTAPQALTHAIAQMLQQSVTESGLFYESKLAQLVKGQISPESLHQQPQASTQAKASSQNATVLAQLANAAGKDTPATSLLQSGIDPSTQQLVRQQLEVLASQMFNWRGEAWPGVPLDLEIQRRRDDDAQQHPDTFHDEDEAPWQSRLKLELPTLGTVQARLHIHDHTVRIQIEAPTASDTLKHHLATLVERLETRGIAIQQLQVLRQDPLYADPDEYSHVYD